MNEAEDGRVTQAAVEQGPAETVGLPLDPFGLQPDVASRVRGLGGNAPGHDHAYVFHTEYVEAAEGPATFTVRFDGLTARQGTLVLRVHMIANEPGAHARLANSDRIQLNRLIGYGGETQIRFEGFHNVRFALYGHIPDQTDAEARGLTVILDNPADPTVARAVAAEARSTDYGTDAVRPSAHLLSLEPARFALPVGQMATAPQLREAPCAAWLRTLPAAAHDLERWRRAYVLQVLDRYGVLTEGARGLALDAPDAPLAQAIAARVGSVETHLPSGEATMPPELVNFDFLWSVGAAEACGSVAATIRLVESAMAALRPGGLAVHVLPFDPRSIAAETVRTEPILRRNELEQIALILISRRHEVAQIKLDGARALIDPATGASAFGLIARKPRLRD